jgi:hypothetical protein
MHVTVDHEIYLFMETNWSQKAWSVWTDLILEQVNVELSDIARSATWDGP